MSNASNQFLRATKEAIQRNGVSVNYKKVGVQSYDPSTGLVTSDSTQYSIMSYPRHIRASQWYFPDLIGKDAIQFYIAGDQLFTPDVKDSIIYDSVEYKIESIQKHFAAGQVCLYRIVTVR